MKSFSSEVRTPKSPAGFKEVECADDVGLDEIARTGDRAIDMRLGGEVHDVRDAVLLDDAQGGCLVAQINFLENIFWVLGNLFQIGQMTGVGEAIKVDELADSGVVNDVLD